MRLGKIEKQVLKVFYEEEHKMKKPSHNFNSFYLTPKVIVTKITKRKFPTKKDFKITPRNQNYHLMFLAQVCSLPKKQREETLAKDPMKKYYLQHEEARKEWNKKTNSIYRAITKLCWKLFIIQLYNYHQKKLMPRYTLSEIGRRIISHRLKSSHIKRI